MEAEQCAHLGTLVDARGTGTVCTNCGLVVSCMIEEEFAGVLPDGACEQRRSGSRMTKRDLEFIQTACERLCLPAEEYRAQIETYCEARMPKVYERNKQAFLAALIILVSRALKHPRIGKEVALALGLKKEDIYRELKGIEKDLMQSEITRDEAVVATSGDIVPRIMAALFAETPAAVPMTDRRRIIMRAKRMADEIEDSAILSGRTPSTIAGVAIYLTECVSGTRSWKKVQVAGAAHIALSTLSKAIDAYSVTSATSTEPKL